MERPPPAAPESARGPPRPGCAGDEIIFPGELASQRRRLGHPGLTEHHPNRYLPIVKIASSPRRQSWLCSLSLRRARPIFWLCLVVPWLGLFGAAAEWQGFARTPVSLDGHSGFVTQPKEAAPGRPWIWRTSFPDYHREVDLALLRRGFHVAYLNVVNLLGCDASLDSMDRFHYRITKEFGLEERPALYAVSRGGLHAYRYAARRPERIACLYADVPVMSLASWPLAAGAVQPLQDALKHYGFADEAALQRFQGNPIDLLEPIAKARLPLRHLISLNDRVVPPEQNTLEAQRRLRALGHKLEIVTIDQGTEKSKGHQFPDTAVDQTVEWIVRHASRPNRAPRAVPGGEWPPASRAAHLGFQPGPEPAQHPPPRRLDLDRLHLGRAGTARRPRQCLSPDRGRRDRSGKL